MKTLTKQQANHRADALNKNKRTSGTNPTNAKLNGNRGKQLNPNQKSKYLPTAAERHRLAATRSSDGQRTICLRVQAVAKAGEMRTSSA